MSVRWNNKLKAFVFSGPPFTSCSHIPSVLPVSTLHNYNIFLEIDHEVLKKALGKPDENFEYFKDEFSHIEVLLTRLELVAALLGIRNILADNREVSSGVTIKSLGPKYYTFKEKGEFGVLGKKVFANLEWKPKTFNGQDFTGVFPHIEALCVYLLLTCIDLVAEGNKKHQNPFDWLIQKIEENEPENMIDFIRRTKERYYSEYGSRHVFVSIITDTISTDLKRRIASHFALVKIHDCKVDKRSRKKWESKSEDERVEAFAKFLYDEIRSRYTHSGHVVTPLVFPASMVETTGKSVILVQEVSYEEEDIISVIFQIVLEVVERQLSPFIEGVNR